MVLWLAPSFPRLFKLQLTLVLMLFLLPRVKGVFSRVCTCATEPHLVLGPILGGPDGFVVGALLMNRICCAVAVLMDRRIDSRAPLTSVCDAAVDAVNRSIP